VPDLGSVGLHDQAEQITLNTADPFVHRVHPLHEIIDVTAW
jgi:hypothetical protein